MYQHAEQTQNMKFSSDHTWQLFKITWSKQSVSFYTTFVFFTKTYVHLFLTIQCDQRIPSITVFTLVSSLCSNVPARGMCRLQRMNSTWLFYHYTKCFRMYL